MSWIQIRAEFARPPEDWSPIAEVFRGHGIEQTQEEATAMSGCLPRVPAATETVDRLVAALAETGAMVSCADLPATNWEEAWRQFFKPRRIGRTLLVRPTWEPAAREAGLREIVLDPGQAFGTGDHPTTRMSLELLEALCPVGSRVADVGCGSGILAIAAVLLGAGEVVALDLDPVAVDVARENAALNEVNLTCLAGDGVESLPGTWDLLVSNIISATLIRIAADVASKVVPEGFWIVSGIIVANWGDVRAAAESSGFVLERQQEEAGWVAAAFRRGA